LIVTTHAEVLYLIGHYKTIGLTRLDLLTPAGLAQRMNPRQTFGPKVHTKLCGKRLRYPCTVTAQEQQALNDKRSGLLKSLRDLRAKRIGEADEALSVPPSAQFASMCERIGAQLEVHHQWRGRSGIT